MSTGLSVWFYFYLSPPHTHTHHTIHIIPYMHIAPPHTHILHHTHTALHTHTHTDTTPLPVLSMHLVLLSTVSETSLQLADIGHPVKMKE